MNSTPNLNANEADDALVARADERLAHAYEKIAEADEQLARLTEHLSKMEHDAARNTPAESRPKPSRGGSTLRGVIGLLSAACIIAAAFVSQSSYGEVAKPVIYRWAPHFVSTLWLPSQKSALPAQPSPSAVQLASAEAAPLQATPSVPTTAREVAPAPPEVAQLLQEMTRALANVEQGIDQLKAAQERMSSDNARIVEQLKVNQEQMTSLIAKSSEQSQVPKASSTVPRPNPTRKPALTQSSPQSRAQP